ncbi:MAG: extracellular solute-binding protein [Clostridia bacterium]|nr:extracellular solute-binding protein [Clostridia bacterium]
MQTFKKIISVALAAVMLSSAAVTASAKGQTLSEQLSSDTDYGVSFEYTDIEDFAEVRQQYIDKGYAAADIDKPVSIKAGDYTASDKPLKLLEDYKGRKNVFLFEAKNDYVEWNFTAPADGIYTVRVEYMAGDEGVTPIMRSLLIDGKNFYSEANKISFYRLFKDDGKPVTNSIGDEVAPDVVQYFDWQWQDLLDTDASYDGGLQFYLSAGKHTLRMESVSGAMYLSAIEFYSSEDIPTYKEIKAEYDSMGYKKGQDKIYFEAEGENVLYKNSSTLRSTTDSDPATSPFKYGNASINAFGDSLWQSANSAITYKFNVKTAGLYAISMRAKMDYRDGIPSYRSIAIDGEIPFEEFKAYRFDYDKNWRTEVLADSAGKPYYIYLSEGEHILTMAVKQGELSPVTSMVEKDSDTLSELLLKIKMIVGQNPDTNYDYELDKQIPDLVPTLKSVIKDMKKCMESFEMIVGRRQSKYYQLKSFATQLQELVDDPFVIPSRITAVEEIITSYGSWLGELQAHPLLLDFIQIIPDETDKKVAKSNFFERLYGSTINFVLSFSKDYNNVSVGEVSGVEIKSTISVWVSRGTKWCTTMKQLIDSDFTPNTGIAVDLNVLPAGQLNSGGANALLLAITSGRAPDVATGVAAGSIGEFAMRNALVDVSKYEGFKDIEKRFISEHFVPLCYEGGVFALPETQNFMAMVYRKDILSRLGLSIPNTWQEVYEKIIPVLNQNNMQFYVQMSAMGYDMFLYQLGGKYYHDDLKTTALDSVEAYRAMVEYTELYSLYGVPKSANFYNRFRSGEMPIGIVDYATYMTVKAAASDISGKWGISLVPGHKREDGSIDRSHNLLSSECCMILDQSDKKDDAWKFLNWWTTEETQLEYANRLESLLGTSARWVSANHNAFGKLAWENDEIDTIMESFKYADQAPVVLGGYYVTRHITNALNRVIVSGINPRDSIEEAVEDINKELKRRRESVAK